MGITEVTVPKQYVLVQTTEPTGAFEGQLWYNSDNDLTYIYQDGEWSLITLDVSQEVLQLATENAQQQIDIIELQANASVTPFDHDTLISDTFSDADGYKDSVNTTNTDAFFSTDKYVRKNNLVVFAYTFEEASGQLIDQQNDNDSTAVAGVTYQQTGIIDYAYYFNQTNKGVTLPALDVNTDLFSFSIWAKPDFPDNSGGAGTNPKIFTLNTTTSVISLWVHTTPAGNTNTIKLNYNGVNYDTTINGTTTNAGFHHIVGTVNGTSLKVYVDNVLKVNQTVIALDEIVTGGYIASSGSVNSYYKGWIDEFYLYNKELTSDDVSNLYNSGSPTAYVPGGYETHTVEIDLPTITGTVTHTELVINGTIETGASITYKLNNGTTDDTEETPNTKNAYNLTGVPTKLKILLNPKETEATDGNPSIKSYCLKLWKA